MVYKTLNHRISGEGKDVILLHGFLESPEIWKDFVSYSKPYFRSINIQLPNHNPKEKEFFPKSLEEQVEQLHQTLIDLEVYKPTFIGHSLGGYLALAYIEKYADDTSGIALINSTCLTDDKKRKTQRNRAIELIESFPDAFIQMAIRNLFTKTSLKIFESEIESMISKAKKLPVTAIQASLIAIRDRKNTCEVLENYSNEKLLIYGKQDPLIPRKQSESIIIKTAVQATALSTGHMSWLEESEAMNKALIQFLLS